MIDTEVGLLRGVQAIGGILGGLVVGLLIRRQSTRTLIGWGFLVFGVIALLTWNFAPVSTMVVVYVALYLLCGVLALLFLRTAAPGPVRASGITPAPVW